VTLDRLARSAGAEVRGKADTGVHTTPMLEAMLRTERRRRRSARLAAVAGAVVVAVVGWQLVSITGPGRAVPAGPRPSGASSSPQPGQTRLQLRVPLTFTLPHGWWSTPSSAGDVDFWSGTNGYGVSVSEGDARPARYVKGAYVDPSVATDARSLASWLATRPYLSTSGAVATTLGGRPAWRVDVRERPGAVEVSPVCGGDYSPPPCIPLFIGPADVIGGIWGNGRIRYVFSDLPDGTTAQVSQWDFTDQGLGFDGSDQLVRSFRFEAPPGSP
jgi:hypothetical protein